MRTTDAVLLFVMVTGTPEAEVALPRLLVVSAVP